jgi:AraC-like DNA-binding protein
MGELDIDEVMPVTSWGRQPNGAEMVQYDAPMFLSFTEHSLLHQYPNMRAECHWHIDLEFTRIFRGHMMYFVSGEIIRLEEGQAIFVNSRQLHYGFSDDGSDCEFSCSLLNPSRMGALTAIHERFVAPLVADSSLPYAVFDEHDEAGDRVVRLLDQVHSAKFGDHALETPRTVPQTAAGMMLTDDLASLTVISCFYALTRELLDVSRQRHAGESRTSAMTHDPHIDVLRAMVDYVQQHYVRPITLDQIAAAGSVGRTTCAKIFRDLLGQTPIEFVNDVRVRAAAELLRSTRLPIASIADRSGFASASFFTRTFRRVMHVTPFEYRKGFEG